MRHMTHENLIVIYKEHARVSEGIKPHVYLDSENIPTIGIGYALADKDRNLYSRASINADLNNASGTRGVEYISVADMSKIASAKNNNDLKGVGPTLSHQQMENLLDISVQRKFDITDRNLANLGINPETTPEPLRKALIDLSFRGGDNLFGKYSPTLNEALKNNDLAGVMIEIKYGSNADNQYGNDVRNDKLVKEIWNSLTPEQQKQVQAELDRQMQTARNQQLKERYEQRQHGRSPSDQGPFKSQGATKNQPGIHAPAAGGSHLYPGPTNANGEVFVHPYSRRTGEVRSHTRSHPDGNSSNNFSAAHPTEANTPHTSNFREPTPEEKKRMPKNKHWPYGPMIKY
jgi:hypothetical protein